jgi:hypothetical protein
MKNHDFDEEIIEDMEDEYTINEEQKVNFSSQVDELKNKQIQTEQSTGKIEISIDSVEKLISNLSFSAQELEAAVAKVEKNRDLNEILNVLSDLRKKDVSEYLSSFEKRLENSIKNIDVRTIETNLQKRLENNFKNIIDASKRYEKYAETFEDQEVLNTFEQIENLEKFTKKFKFKSIVFSSLLSLSIGLTTSYVATYSYFKFSEDRKITQMKEMLFNKKNSILRVFKNKEFGIVEGINPSTNKTVTQIIFPTNKNKKINFFVNNNKNGKTNVLEFEE